MMKMAKGKMWRRGMFMLSMILSLRLRMRNLSVLRGLVILESFLDKKTYVISIDFRETYTDGTLGVHDGYDAENTQCGFRCHWL